MSTEKRVLVLQGGWYVILGSSPILHGTCPPSELLLITEIISLVTRSQFFSGTKGARKPNSPERCVFEAGQDSSECPGS